MSIRFSDLPQASSLTGDEIIPVTQDSTDKQTTAQDIANLAKVFTSNGAIFPDIPPLPTPVEPTQWNIDVLGPNRGVYQITGDITAQVFDNLVYAPDTIFDIEFIIINMGEVDYAFNPSSVQVWFGDPAPTSIAASSFLLFKIGVLGTTVYGECKTSSSV